MDTYATASMCAAAVDIVDVAVTAAVVPQVPCRAQEEGAVGEAEGETAETRRQGSASIHPRC